MLYLSLILSIVLATLHFIATYLYFYWIYWWFDMLMHFLAGVTGGAAAYGVLERFNRVTLTRIILSFLVVGGAWEVFEYVNGITNSHESYPVDVTIDMILGIIGSVLAYKIGKRMSRGSNSEVTSVTQ